jgi:hypothetical protein
MAKYTIEYACGHGSYEDQLFGPGKDRERRIAWAEANKVCRSCWIARRKAEDLAAPKIAKVQLSGLGNSDPVVTVSVSGQLEANMDALKALGYAWGHGVGVMDMLSVHEPAKQFMLSHQPTDMPELELWVAKAVNDLLALGYRVATDLNPLDLHMFQQALAAREQKTLQLAMLDKPVRPAWLQAMMATAGSFWNGKVYRGGIYISGDLHPLTPVQRRELEAYISAKDVYLAKKKALDEGVNNG